MENEKNKDFLRSDSLDIAHFGRPLLENDTDLKYKWEEICKFFRQYYGHLDKK